MKLFIWLMFGRNVVHHGGGLAVRTADVNVAFSSFLLFILEPHEMLTPRFMVSLPYSIKSV